MNTTTIPRVIHYVWVGGKPLTPLAQTCINSWKKNLPNYELKLWNEKNSPMDHHYVRAMYEQKKWAFVSDYIRFWALSREGGIYLDTDMEILKPLDDLLQNPSGFVGRSSSGHIESSIIAAPRGAEFVATALAFYENDRNYTIKETSPIVLQRALEKTPDHGVMIYDHRYFHPCDEGRSCPPQLLKNAYARHHWAESWVPHAGMRKAARRLGVMSILKGIKSIVAR